MALRSVALSAMSESAGQLINKCIDKALAAGAQAGSKYIYHSPKEPEILDDANAWVVNLACTMQGVYIFCVKVEGARKR